MFWTKFYEFGWFPKTDFPIFPLLSWLNVKPLSTKYQPLGRLLLDAFTQLYKTKITREEFGGCITCLSSKNQYLGSKKKGNHSNNILYCPITWTTHLVVLEHGQLDFLVLMSNFLRCRIILLLSLLATSTKSQNKMKGWLLLDVVVAQCSSIF